MHRTFVGDLRQPRPLRVVEPAREHELALDLIELAFLRLAVGTVLRVDAGVAEANGDAVERPTFASRIQRERHGRSGTQRGQQEIVGRGPGVAAAVWHRLVGDQSMPADEHFLREARGASVHGYRGHRALLTRRGSGPTGRTRARPPWTTSRPPD